MGSFQVGAGAATVGCAVVGIYGVCGNLVRPLGRGEFAAGEHVLVRDGRDDVGRGVPTGLYEVRRTAGEQHFARPVAMLRSRDGLESTGTSALSR